MHACRSTLEDPTTLNFPAGTYTDGDFYSFDTKAPIVLGSNALDEMDIQQWGAVAWPTQADAQMNADSSAPIQMALHAMRIANDSGRTLVVPCGWYRVQNQLVAASPGQLLGRSGSLQLQRSAFAFDDEVWMLFDQGPLGSCNGLRAEGILFQGYGAGATEVDQGVLVRATVRFAHCAFIGFAGQGCVVSTEDGAYIADSFEFSRCWFENNKGDGLEVVGIDANAGLIEHCNSISNGGWGFYDHSFLGNTYIGCHTDSNGDPEADPPKGAYRVSNNRSVLIGCYAELGQPPNIIEHPAIVLGGSLEAVGFAPTDAGRALAINDRYSISAFRVWNDLSPIRIETLVGVDDPSQDALRWRAPTWQPYKLKGDTAIINELGPDIRLVPTETLNPALHVGREVLINSTGDAELTIETGVYAVTSVADPMDPIPNSFTIDLPGTGAATTTFERTAALVEDPNEYILKYEEGAGSWLAQSSLFVAFSLTGTRHPIGPGRLVFEQGFLVGDGSNARVVIVRADRPTTNDSPRNPPGGTAGLWVKGDRVLAKDPESGQPYEWICIGDSDGLHAEGYWAALSLP